MKLDWKRAGCMCIAEISGYTALVWRTETGLWHYEVRASTGRRCAEYSKPQESFTDAESACEAWLEQHDRPEWNDVTDWLSWSEWRGLKILVRPETDCAIGTYYGQATDARGMTRSVPSMICTTVEKAKVAAEKWVREQREKA